MRISLWIAQREIAERMRDGRVILSAAALLVMLLSSFALGWQRYYSRNRQATDIQNSERARWLAQRDRSPHTAAHQGIYVFRQQSLLSTFDSGVDGFFGIATHAEDEQHFFEWKPAEDETIAHRFGQVAVGGMLQYILPLLLILLTYPVFVAERENGIARLTLSLGVHRRDYVLGKLLGALLPMGVLLPVAVLLLASLRLLSGGPAFRNALPAVLLLAGSYVLYTIVFVGVALGISALAHSSRAALLSLLLFWSLLSFVFPHLAIEVVERAIRTPTAAEILEARQAAAVASPNRDDQIREIQKELLATYRVSDVKQLPLSPVGVFMLRSLEAGEPASAAVFDRAYGAYLRQEHMFGSFGLLDPTISIQDLSMALAQTDSEAMVDAAHSAERYRFNLVRTMNRDIALHRDPTLPINTLADDYHRGIEVWSQVPPYMYLGPSIGQIMRHHTRSLLFLWLWVVSAAGFATLAIRRMKVDA